MQRAMKTWKSRELKAKMSKTDLDSMDKNCRQNAELPWLLVIMAPIFAVHRKIRMCEQLKVKLRRHSLSLDVSISWTLVISKKSLGTEQLELTNLYTHSKILFPAKCIWASRSANQMLAWNSSGSGWMRPWRNKRISIHRQRKCPWKMERSKCSALSKLVIASIPRTQQVIVIIATICHRFC